MSIMTSTLTYWLMAGGAVLVVLAIYGNASTRGRTRRVI